MVDELTAVVGVDTADGNGNWLAAWSMASTTCRRARLDTERLMVQPMAMSVMVSG